MVLDLVLRSLSLASLTTPLALSIFLTIYSALSLALYLSLLAAFGVCPRSLHYPNIIFIILSISMAFYSHSFWISLVSLFASNLKLLVSLIVASILVLNSSLASSNFFVSPLSEGPLITFPNPLHLVPRTIFPKYQSPLLRSFYFYSKWFISFPPHLLETCRPFRQRIFSIS